MNTITLTKDELNKIKKDFFNGGVMTDGCFCGEAVSNFRDILYVLMNFSCRKSGGVDNPYYEVTRVVIGRKANEVFTDGYIDKLVDVEQKAEFGFTVSDIDGYDVFKDDRWNYYLIDNELVFDDDSLRLVQKQLFKYYKEKFYSYGDVKFKHVGKFEYEIVKPQFIISDVATVVLIDKTTNEVVFEGEIPTNKIEIIKEEI